MRLAPLRTPPFRALGLACCLAAAGQAQEGLSGNPLTPPLAAQDFSLKDQTGAPFTLSSTRGKVVVLSFIYTHCTDICPFVALKLKEARALLGAEAGQVVFVAVTTDPGRDTVPVIARYSRQAGLAEGWHFLTGSPRAVRKVWADYGIFTEISRTSTPSGADGDDEQDPDQGLSPQDKALAVRLAKQFGGGYEVGHSAPFWLVDPKGLVREILDADALPEDIVRDVKLLLKDS